MKKHRAGGNYTQTSKEARRHTLREPIYHNEGRGYQRGGSVKGGSGSGLGRLRKTHAAAKVPDKTES
jgi:hypothetical protein